MPYISTEALVGAALLVVVALGYQYIPKTGGEAATASKAIKKKNKKKAKASGGSTTASDIKDAVTTGPSSSKKGNETIKSKENGAGSTSKAAPSDPAQVSRQTAKPKTLAQKIAPQPRKSKVDDMLAPEDLPGQHARIMRVAPAPGALPSPSPATLAPPEQQKVDKYSDDYASSSSDEDGPRVDGSLSFRSQDDGWGVVQPKKKKPVSISFSGTAENTSTALPLPTATKIQRKNQKKAEAKKAAKAAEEEERLRRLGMHKRQLEKAKIDEIYGASKKKGSGGGGGSKPTAPGGTSSKATLDHNGKLIWD